VCAREGEWSLNSGLGAFGGCSGALILYNDSRVIVDSRSGRRDRVTSDNHIYTAIFKLRLEGNARSTIAMASLALAYTNPQLSNFHCRVYSFLPAKTPKVSFQKPNRVQECMSRPTPDQILISFPARKRGFRGRERIQ
jgi:hypothetical protein